MQVTTIQRVNRRALRMYPPLALTLATLMGLLALPAAPARPGWVVLHSSFDTVTVTAAVLTTLAIGVLIVTGARRA